MARFAPVCPIQVLEALYDRDPHLFGDYHLLLAHHTAAEKDRFAALFRRIEEDGVLYPLVIMDNSLVELKGAVDLDMMKTACEAVNQGAAISTVVVLPDVYRGGQATRQAITDAYDKWEDELVGEHCDELMAVLQGETMDEFAATLEHASLLIDVGWWGIPRVLVEQHGSRFEALELALSQSRQSGHQIHLLGFSDNMEDDVKCARMQGVDGIDSAVPMRLSEELDIRMVPEPRPENWFETATVTPLMIENLNTARYLVRGN